MSPLIDCVFLLLIFFLVTTMLKKKERRLPIQQPDSVMSVAANVEDGSNYLGVSREGKYLRPTGEYDPDFGYKIYAPVSDLPAYLKSLARNGGKDKPLIIHANKELEFQETIRVWDICTIQGFKHVSVAMDSDNFDAKHRRKEADETKK